MSAPTRLKKRKSLAERRRAARVAVLSGVGVLALAVLGGAVYALHLPAVTIALVTVSDVTRVDPDHVVRVASGPLTGSYALVIPRSFAFLYPRAEIIDSLKKEFPMFETVDVERRGLTALAVTVTERAPVARWCSDQCYLMDATGTIFDRADSVSGIAYSGMVEGEPVAQVFLGGGFPALATLLEDVAVATGRTPSAVSVDAEDDVNVTLVSGGEIRFSLKGDHEALLENMRVTFASKLFTSGTPFEYVDFRFGHKVYVKWE